MLQWVVCVLCHAGWGAPIYKLKNLQLEKIKIENDYVQLEKIKSKKKLKKKAMYNSKSKN